LRRGVGNIARLDHGFERTTLMFHVPFGDFHQIGNEIVAALELDVDLSEGIFESIAQRDEGVVDARDRQAENNDNDEQNSEDDQDSTHNVFGWVGPTR
jgi:hypothetical protein